MIKRHNIFFIIESAFPYYTGGIENWLYNILIRLPKDYNTTVISDQCRCYNSPFYEIPNHIKIIKYRTPRWLHYLHYLVGDYARKFEILLKAKTIEKVISNHVDAPDDTILFALGTIAPSIACKKFKSKHESVRFLCSARGIHADTESISYPRISHFLFEQEEKNVHSADLLLTNGYDTQAYYFKHYAVKSLVLLNGVNVHAFDIDQSESPYEMHGPIIVSVGTLIDIKCVNELIKAFAILKKNKGVKAHLCFVGKCSSEKYKTLANELGISSDISFLGNKTNVIPYLKHADVATCLSEGGGFSMAALEAMASKTPIVAWDSPIYQQFNMTNKTMELVRVKDVEQLADALSTIINHKELFCELGLAAHREAQKYDWNNVLINLKKILA